MTKTPRPPRRSSYDPYAIVSGMNQTPLTGTLMNISNTGALFAVQGVLYMDEHIVACPLEKDSAFNLPSRDKILSHPEALKGEVVRKEGTDRYAIQFEVPISADIGQLESASAESDLQFNDKGNRIDFILKGTSDIKKIVRFHDMLKEKSLSAMQILLDFSQTQQIPRISSAILGDLIEKRIQEKRRFAIVNESLFGGSFAKRFQHREKYNSFFSYEEADEYLNRNRLTVLLVEDEETTRNLITQYLKKRSYNVVEAVSGEEAMKRLQEFAPDLILMDIHLPGMDGIAAVELIRRDRKTQLIPIVMLTGESSRKTVEKTIKMRINGYILKPIDVKTFHQQIVTILARSPRL